MWFDRDEFHKGKFSLHFLTAHKLINLINWFENMILEILFTIIIYLIGNFFFYTTEPNLFVILFVLYGLGFNTTPIGNFCLFSSYTHKTNVLKLQKLKMQCKSKGRR